MYFSTCNNSMKRVVIVYSRVLCIVLYDVNASMVKDRKVSVDQASCGTGKKQEDVWGENQWFRIRYHGRSQILFQVTGLGTRILAMMMGGIKTTYVSSNYDH